MKQLEEFFQKRIKVQEVTPSKFAIAFPMYKIGTVPPPPAPPPPPAMYELFLVNENGGFYLSDEGATYAELDKIFELSEPDVIKNLVAILRQYGCKKVGKNITIECTPKDIHIKMSYLIQAISFMLNMKIFYV